MWAPTAKLETALSWLTENVTTPFCTDQFAFPEPANFLRRMLVENEGSGKDQFLGDPD